MKVQMKFKIQGSRNGVRWPDAGGVVDLPDNEAADLCAAGIAEPADEIGVEPAKSEKPQKADPVAEPVKPEKAVAKKPEKRNRLWR